PGLAAGAGSCSDALRRGSPDTTPRSARPDGWQDRRGWGCPECSTHAARAVGPALRRTTTPDESGRVRAPAECWPRPGPGRATLRALSRGGRSRQDSRSQPSLCPGTQAPGTTVTCAPRVAVEPAGRWPRALAPRARAADGAAGDRPGVSTTWRATPTSGRGCPPGSP